MRPDIGDWSELLAEEREMDYFESLYSFLYDNQSKEIYHQKKIGIKPLNTPALSTQRSLFLAKTLITA